MVSAFADQFLDQSYIAMAGEGFGIYLLGIFIISYLYGHYHPHQNWMDDAHISLMVTWPILAILGIPFVIGIGLPLYILVSIAEFLREKGHLRARSKMLAQRQINETQFFEDEPSANA